MVETARASFFRTVDGAVGQTHRRCRTSATSLAGYLPGISVMSAEPIEGTDFSTGLNLILAQKIVYLPYGNPKQTWSVSPKSVE